MKWLAIGFAGLLCSSASASAPAAADRLSGTCGNVSAEVLRYGLAAGTLAEEVADDTDATAAGVFWNMTDIRLIERTDRIPLRDGSIMYLQYKAKNRHGNVRLIPLRLLTLFPSPGMTNPDGTTHAQAEKSFSLAATFNAATDEAYWTFTDQYPFEMVEGTWTWQVFHDGCLLLEKSFAAYKTQP